MFEYFYSFSLIIIIILLKKYINGTYCSVQKNLKGRIIFITGANSGIGKTTAEELAKKGAILIMACRDLKKAERVRNQLENKVKLN